MKPIAGLNRDITPISQPPDTMRYAANGLISESTGLATNIKDELLWDEYDPLATNFLGQCLGNTNIYIWIWNDVIGQGEIWRTDPELDGGKELVIIDPTSMLELNQEFADRKVLQIVFQQDFEEHEVFAWAGQTRPKIIDIGAIIETNLGVTPVDLTAGGYTIKDFLLYPEGELHHPDIISVNESGGKVMSGAWFFCYRYVYPDLSVTSFSGMSSPAYVFEEPSSKGSSLMGDDGNRLTPKSVTIGFHLDPGQSDATFVQFGYISIRDGVIFAGILDKVSRSTVLTEQYVYTGNLPEVDLGDSILELITPKAIYTNIGTITSLTSRLYAGCLTAKEEADVQEVANNAVVDWYQSNLNNSSDFLRRDKGFLANQPSFGHGDVYAVYLHLNYTDGTMSRGFHIPGRKWQGNQPLVSSTGVVQIIGNAAGDGNVGFTIDGIVTYTIAPIAADTPAIMAAALAIPVNAGGVVTAVVAGDSLNLTYIAGGTVGNNVLLEASTDSTASTSRSGMSGGIDFVESDTDIVQDGLERYQLWDTGEAYDNYHGRCGYWVNSNEFYPDTPEFASALDPGSPYPNQVRHHKIPSLGWMWNNLYIDNPLNCLLFNLDVDISALPFSAEVLAKISGWSVSFAKRSYGDMLNLTTEIPTNFGYWSNLTDLVSSPGIFATGTRGATVPDSDHEVLLSDLVLKYHGLHLLNDRPAIAPRYTVEEATLETDAWGVATFLMVNSDLFTNIAGTADQTVAAAYKYGHITLNLNGITYTSGGENTRYLDISDSAYIKNAVRYTLTDGASLVSINNNAGEDCFAVYRPDTFDSVFTELKPFGDISLPQRLYISSLRQVPENICSAFSSQVLINPISVDKSVTLLRHNKGDVWCGDYQFNTTGVIGGYDDPLNPGTFALLDTTTDEAGMFNGEGSKLIYNMFAYAPINFLLQQADAGDFQSYIDPILGNQGLQSGSSPVSSPYDGAQVAKIDSWYLSLMDIYQSMTFIYNEDFHRYSEYFIYGINDGFFIQNNSFPTVIAFSLAQPTDSPQRQWRNWLIENKYVQPSEKGKIVNLKGAGNQMLYIHHRYSLYTTKDRIAMQTNSVDVIVGSSDIFEVTPYEIVSVDEGQTGISNRNFHTLSPFGYAWIQVDSGKIYSHDGKSLDEMSGRGLRNYFKDNITLVNNVEDESCFIINDDLRRRILVGFSHDNEILPKEGVTIAYSTQGQTWSFWQDSFKTFPIVARDKRVFMWGMTIDVEASIYAVAEGAHNNLTRPFVIEAVMNDGDSLQKYLQFLKWNTNVWSNNIDQEFETFNTLVVYSDTKIYGLPDLIVPEEWAPNLVPYVGFPKGTQNVRRLEDEWSTNTFRDIWDGSTYIQNNIVGNNVPNTDAIDLAKTWDQKSRMRDKYLIVRLFYKKDNDFKIEFESLEFGMKPSFR